MKKPFGRLAMLSLVVVSMLLTSVFWAGPGTVRAQDEESLAGDVPVDSLEAAGPLGPDIPYDPGEGPGLPVETPPDNSLTPDGMPLDDMAPAPEAVAPPEGDAAMPGVAGADSNAESPVVEPNGGGFAYPGIGFTPDCGLSYLLPRAVGQQRALELLLTGRRLTADEALGWGLVSEVVDDGGGARRAAQLAAVLAGGPQFALGQARALARSSWETPRSAVGLEEARVIAEAVGHPDAQARIAAFTSRR